MVQQSTILEEMYLNFFVDQDSIFRGCVIYMLCLASWIFSWQNQLIWLVRDWRVAMRWLRSQCFSSLSSLLLFPEHHCDHMAEINLAILLLALFTLSLISPWPRISKLITQSSWTSCDPALAPAGDSCFIKNIEYHIIIFPTLYAMLDQYIYSTPYCAPIIFNCWSGKQRKKFELWKSKYSIIHPYWNHLDQ